ncbi:MAG TPA: hypothetical protein VN813_04260 [Luteibacter sp.]|nr:hypothetical protein [Luteibacter sp.]
MLEAVFVTLEQERVYRNGRQQARVRLDLESTRGGIPSDLTPREIESIQLFDYHNTATETIPFSEDGSVTYQGWSAQHVYRGYAPHPDTRDRPRARQTFFLYLTANAGAVEPLDVSFVLQGDDLSIWRTNGKVTMLGVDQRLEAMDKKVDITMTPIAPVTYPANAFLLDRRPLPRSGSTGEAEKATGIFDDIVTISIMLADQTKLGIRDMQCDPAGMVHWINKLPGTRNPCFTGYAQPGETTIHWNESMDGHLGSVALPELPGPETDLGVIVLCGRVDIPTWTGAPEAPVHVTMTDAYGSTQTCHIGFVVGERDELIVT